MSVGLAPFIQEHVLEANKDEREKQRDENGNYLPTEVDYTVNTEPFFDVAWDLCRSGVLAPAPEWDKGQNRFGVRAEFRITPRGSTWLLENKDEPVLPAELAKFLAALKSHVGRFGDVYEGRAVEALRCYHAHCFYASCVMCGAAAEAILLKLASKKTGDGAEAERLLATAKGRDKLIATLKQQKNSHLQKSLDQFTNLVAYYRDDAAHATQEPIDEDGAHLAIMTLLRLARFGDDRWDDVVA